MKRLLITLALAAVFGGSCPTAIASAPSGSSSLQQEKLREEIKQLQLSNQGQEGLSGFIRAYGGMLTGLGAVIGALLAVRKYSNQRKDERKAEQNQREKDMEQQKIDAELRADEAFTRVIAGLATEKPYERVAAAAGLWTFTEPAYEKYWPQIYRLALANLKLGGDDETSRQLVDVFTTVLKLLPAPHEIDTDFSRAYLARADLSGLRDASETKDVDGESTTLKSASNGKSANNSKSLRGFDFSSANLSDADLRNSDLTGATGTEVDIRRARLSGPSASLETVRFQKARADGAIFQQGRLVNAHFEYAELTNAQFQQARLQGAHFENASLHGARFEEADIADARFTGATLDVVALGSILDAKRWQGAHFSQKEQDWLKEADARRQKNDPPNEANASNERVSAEATPAVAPAQVTATAVVPPAESPKEKKT